MKISAITVGVLLALLISNTGCSTQNAPAESPILTSEAYTARSLQDPGLTAFLKQVGLPTNRPWDFEKLYWTAIYFNPGFAETRAQLAVLNAAKMTANQSPNPTLTLIPTYDNSVTPTAFLLGAGLTIPIETNGKRGLRLETADAQWQSAQWQTVTKAWDLRNALLVSLMNRDTAIETITYADRLAKTQSALVKEYDERTAQGQIPTAFATQAEVSYQQTLLQREQLKTQKRQAEVTLAGILGITVEALDSITIAGTLPKSHMISLQDPKVRKSILDNHPLLRSAFADYLAAHHALQLELAKQMPDIAIGPGYEWNSTQGGKLSLGITLVLPIFNNNEGPVAEALAKRNLAARHFETVQATVINAMEQADAARLSAMRELKTTQSIVQLQQTKLDRLRTMLKGKNTQIPLLYAQGETQNVQITEFTAQQKWWRAMAAVEDAVRIPVFGPDFLAAHPIARLEGLP